MPVRATPRRRAAILRRGRRASSGALFARVHLLGLLADGRSHQPCGTDIARGLNGGPPADLLDAVALLRTGSARASASKPSAPTARGCSSPRCTTSSSTASRRSGDLDLPPLLLARPMKPGARADCASLAPRAALRLLAGTAGGLFVRSRAPSAGLFLSGAPGSFVDANDFDYYPRPLRPAHRHQVEPLGGRR